MITNQELDPLPSPPDEAVAPPTELLTVNEAAHALGVDSFTVFSLIQRGRVVPSRSPSGEIMLAQSELAKLAQKGR